MIKNKDLIINCIRSEGKGGQHVSRMSDGVEVIHIPSGLKAFANMERSSHQNKEIAIKMIQKGLETQ